MSDSRGADRGSGFAAAAVLSLVAACSPSNTDGGSIDDLIAPPSVSVVTADPSAVAALSVLSTRVSSDGAHALGPSTFPAGADYFQDRVHDYVFDRALDELEIVNDVLCLIAQTHYQDFVNSGLYRAQIDGELCDSKSHSVNQPGQQKSFEDWIVHSNRRTLRDPQRVEFWVPMMNDMGNGGGGSQPPPTTLFSAVDIFSAPTIANPFGIFEMNFAGTPIGGTPHDPLFCGQIKTTVPNGGRIGYELFFLRGNPNNLPPVGERHELLQVKVDVATDQLSGIASVRKTSRSNDAQKGDSGILTDSFKLAFAGDTLVRVQGGQQAGPVAALSRSNFVACNLRYNLYDDSTAGGTGGGGTGPGGPGSRLAIQSGVPILLADGGHAFLDYYGLTVPAGSTVANGDPVFKEIPGGGVDPSPLTVVIAPGRLIESTRRSTPLTQIVGETFEWDRPFNPNNPSLNRFKLVYDGVGFLAIEQFDFVTGQYVPISPFYVQVQNFGSIQMRSQRYGSVVYQDLAIDIIWHTERVVSGDPSLFGTPGSPLRLFGLIDAMRPQLTAPEVEMGDIYFAPPTSPAQPFVYEISATDWTLRFDNKTAPPLPAVTIVAGQVPKSGPFVNGMRSGPLVTSTAGFQTNQDIFDVPLYYIWETGVNPWNQWFGLVDSNQQTLLINPPLQFAYTHTTANDANGDASQDGKEFLLEYRGDGQLYGIPFKMIDTDGDTFPDHSVPLFNIADGVSMGPTGVEYVVKTIERELILAAASSVPPGLDPSLADVLVVPDGSRYVTPAIGAVPPLSAPPSVVGGELLSVSQK